MEPLETTREQKGEINVENDLPPESSYRTHDLFARPAIWKDEWLEPSFCEARRLNTPAAWRAILAEHLPGDVEIGAP